MSVPRGVRRPEQAVVAIVAEPAPGAANGAGNAVSASVGATLVSSSAGTAIGGPPASALAARPERGVAGITVVAAVTVAVAVAAVVATVLRGW